MNNKPEIKDEIEIDLLDLLLFIKTKWLVILIAAVIGALVGLAMVPAPEQKVYVSSTNMLVYSNELKTDDSVTALNAAQKLASTASVVIQSNRVYCEVIEQLGLDMTPAELKKCILVGTVDSTQMLYITVKHPEEALSKSIAAKVIEVAPGILDEAINIQMIVQFGEIVTSESVPAKVDPTENIVTFAVIGFVIAVLAVAVLELFNTTVKTKKELETMLGVPVLAVIPSEKSSKKESEKYLHRVRRV